MFQVGTSKSGNVEKLAYIILGQKAFSDLLVVFRSRMDGLTDGQMYKLELISQELTL